MRRCPFCNTGALDVIRYKKVRSDAVFAVTCSTCGTSTLNSFASPKQATLAWIRGEIFEPIKEGELNADQIGSGGKAPY